MKVLFIGGTGLISQAVSRLAVERGIELYLLNRGQRNDNVPEGAHIITGDIRDTTAVAEALANYEFDSVVDWISFTPEEVKANIGLLKGKTAQYIFISSASAYQKPPTHYLITESTPLANPYWQYSRDKIACENLLMDEYRNDGFPITIVRPSFTYGDTMIPAGLNSWNHPWSLIDRMRSGQKIIVHGDGTSLWTMTHNSDFAKGIVGLIGHHQSIGHAFHITSDEVLNWNQIYRAIGAAAGVEPNIVHIATDFITAFSPESTGGLLGDKAVSAVFDNSKIKRFVPDFIATTPFHQGIKRTVQWFEARPEKCTIDQSWNDLMDRIVAANEAGAARAINDK
ncbi:SDR family oxidoreductase [Paenibacillus radicis (ex Xue et al. 2023)]|uniref:SDR family oxidoreductase n=1 Tax=Paenibacillus radicis (ex Xue et al. 2023) TaxID=2972489 RepID=A0ABT1YTW2_9BACL|nr:SDR family oxidoreductase [Paenibacillus radicis (ex Xue et al. 2023)]MCR8635430.1 SDR family oxidoreductase [Paenibacillus radicis (ex Xue et al. 2023)]